MNVLTRKNIKWQWRKEQQKAFNKLKRIFTTRPVLVAPDLDKEFRIEVNVLNYATGGVLSMKCSDKLWKPVAFISKSLSNTERNYKIHNKEISVVVRYLEAWRHFLKETTIKFEIWTDHKNLEYFMKAQRLNRRQARWALYLSRFDFMLKHILESKIGKADSLSRRPDWEVGIEKNNIGKTRMVGSEENRKSGRNSGRNRSTGESETVKNKRQQSGQSSRRDKTSRCKDVKK